MVLSHVPYVHLPFYEGTCKKNQTGQSQKTAALWPNTTYAKFGLQQIFCMFQKRANVHACADNMHVVRINAFRIFSYLKFWCLTFFYNQNLRS